MPLDLSLYNYNEVLVKTLLQHAGKCTVRECDEQPPGTFVAYVDEGPDSFDVSLSLNARQEITVHACDCGQTAFCRHRAALLLYLAAGPKAGKTTNPVKAVKKARKLSPALLLLQETDASALKAWLSDLFLKNKDAELAFIHHFSASGQQYNPEDAEKITMDAIQAVVKNRKKLDVSEVKKLVELWEQVHTPIVQYYHDHAADPRAFLVFHRLLESCLLYQAQIRTNSTRIPKYAEHRLKQSVAALYRLQQPQAWQTAVSYFIKNLAVSNHPEIRAHYLKHLDDLRHVPDGDRRQALLRDLLQHYASIDPSHLLNGDRYTETLFRMLLENNLFEAHSGLFKPIPYNNDYNVQLIAQFIKQGDTVRAAQYCEDQIRSNVREEFNIPYWHLLREIYRSQHQDQKLMRVLSGLVPYTFHTDDFLWVQTHLYSDDERRRWRSAVWNRARNEIQKGSMAALLFSFDLLQREHDYRSMVQQLGPYIPYQLVLVHGEAMAQADKTGLLKALLLINDSYLRILWNYTDGDIEEQRQAFPELFNLLLHHFSRLELADTVKQFLKSHAHANPNAFVYYLNERL